MDLPLLRWRTREGTASSVWEALSVGFLWCVQLGYPEGTEIPRSGDNWIAPEFFQGASLLSHIKFSLGRTCEF